MRGFRQRKSPESDAVRRAEEHDAPDALTRPGERGIARGRDGPGVDVTGVRDDEGLGRAASRRRPCKEALEHGTELDGRSRVELPGDCRGTYRAAGDRKSVV